MFGTKAKQVKEKQATDQRKRQYLLSKITKSFERIERKIYYNKGEKMFAQKCQELILERAICTPKEFRENVCHGIFISKLNQKRLLEFIKGIRKQPNKVALSHSLRGVFENFVKPPTTNEEIWEQIEYLSKHDDIPHDVIRAMFITKNLNLSYLKKDKSLRVPKDLFDKHTAYLVCVAGVFIAPLPLSLDGNVLIDEKPDVDLYKMMPVKIPKNKKHTNISKLGIDRQQPTITDVNNVKIDDSLWFYNIVQPDLDTLITIFSQSDN